MTERTAFELEELTRFLCKNRTSVIRELIEDRAKKEGIKYGSARKSEGRDQG